MTTPDEHRVAAAALLALAGMGPASLRRLLEVWCDPLDVVAAVRSGRAAGALAGLPGHAAGRVRRWATELDVERTRAVLTARGTRVLLATDADSPIDPGLADHPPVLLAEGSRADALARPRVAVVGTRAATPHGLADAEELGATLAGAGVTVVSGLAIGIDAAAHVGALAAGGTAVGVLGTGLDVVYPRRHKTLHERVRDAGVLISEYPYGVGPHPSRFPIRNRIIAALADVIVVVEATERGGARITADRALEYGRELCAYPGSRRNPAARGSNELLRSAHPVIDPDDVLGVLGLTPGDRRSPARADTAPAATADEQAVLGALGGEAGTVDDLTSRTGLGPGPVAVALAGLVRAGRIRRAHGLLWPT